MYRYLVLFMLVTMPAYGQSSWCGIYACNKFTASESEAQLIASQAQAYVRFDFSAQPDTILGPFALGGDVSGKAHVPFPQQVTIAKRVDIPGHTGNWYTDLWEPTLWLRNNGNIFISDGHYSLDNNWIGDGYAPNRWQMLFYPRVSIVVPEPNSGLLAGIACLALFVWLYFICVRWRRNND